MLSRQEEILRLLAGKENISVAELSQQLDVSEVTIRSDLNLLVEQGKVSRIHGGARLLEERIKQELTFQTRKNLNLEKKRKIGEFASRFVNSLDSILLDSSTTALALASEFCNKYELKELTVIPTGVWTAIELMGCQNINVLLPGGYLRHTSGSIMGLPTNDFLKDLIIQKAFLGAWGISFEKGLTDTHLLEIELKKFVVNRVKEVIVLVDGSKFNQSGLAAYADVAQISKIVTDSTAPQKELDKFKRAGIEVFIADRKE
jgi:DeoR/GlpR family transcriptional regulator of sugar metabolism